MEFKLNPDGSMSAGSGSAGSGSAGSGGGQGGKTTAPLYVEPSLDQPAPGGQPTAPAGDLIKDVGMATFMQDVIEESKNVPVIVDFWAPWCGPCKTLGPALEKLVTQAGGLVKMAKVNVDENQEIAAQMRVQSIPAVFAFKQGQPVDGFTGAVPESQLKAFVEKLLDGAKPPIDAALEQAQAALDAGDGLAAGSMYREIQTQDPGNPVAIGGMIRSAMMIEQLPLAREMADGLPEELRKKPEIAAAVTALELAEMGEGTDDSETVALKAASEASPADHQARFDYANALIGSGRNEEGLDELLEIVRRDRAWNEEAARQQVLKVFEALGSNDPVTQDGRRKLSTILFS